MGLHSVSDFYAMFQYSFTRVSTASGGDVNFQGIKVKCNDFDPLAASENTESSSNSVVSEQFSEASSLRLRSYLLSDLTIKNDHTEPPVFFSYIKNACTHVNGQKILFLPHDVQNLEK